MTINKKLLRRFLHDYPFQPATAVWRATEIDHVIAYPFPEGFGLDLGCGDGQLTQIILESVGTRSMVGIDIDPQEAALAEKSGIYERIHITPADQIPEKDSCFDWVFSNSVLEHIPNLDDVIAEVSRLLRPGGPFLLTVPGDKFYQCLGGAKVTANGCAVNQSLVLKNVHFAFNKAVLTNDSKTVLDTVAKTIIDSPGFTIEIGGYTDSIGSDAANQKLSEARANAVRSYLIGKGVTAGALTAKGYGEANPVASNDDETGRADNRRVEMRVIN